MRYAIFTAVSFFCLATPSFGQTTTSAPGEVVAQVVQAAEALLGELTEQQREQLLFSFDDDRQRRHWSNLPTGIFARTGLRMGDLNEAQKEAVLRLLRSTLSERGFQQVVDNMTGDEVLKGRERQGRLIFGADEYYVSILGQPSAATPWMWQFGGHHLGINATIVGEQITLSPSLTGGQPVDYTLDGKQVRQLAGDADKAFALIASLSGDQRQQAVVANQLADLAYGPEADTMQPKQEGINAGSLNAQQQALLLDLIEERIGLLNDTHSQMAMDEISAELASTFFAWFGPTTEGAAATFRIQGPSLVVEYAPQRMGGNATDHIHAMYRDPSNDYGVAFAIPTAVGDAPAARPQAVFLQQNYPNPFNSATTIQFQLDQPAKVELAVYNLAGQHLTTILNEFRYAGQHTVRWYSHSLSSGVYLYRLHVGDQTIARKLVLLR